MTGKETVELDVGKLIVRAIEYCKRGSFLEAEKLLNKVLANEPENLQALSTLGTLLCERGNPAVGERYLRKVLEIDPRNELAQNNLGHSLLVQGLVEEAHEAFSLAVKHHPQSLANYHNLACSAMSLKKWNQAIHALELVLEHAPDDTEALRGMGLACSGAGNPEKAIIYFEKAAKAKPENHDTWYNLGNTQMDLRRFQEAKSSFNKVLELIPEHKDAATNLAQSKLELEEFEETLPILQRLVIQFPDEWRNWVSLGQVHYSRLELTAALKAFKKATEIAPEQWECWNSLGVAVHETGDFDTAEKLFNKALELSPEAADGHWNLSITLLSKGNFTKGWEEQAWRWKRSTFTSKMPITQSRLWNGETGSLCLHTEQGFGDNIQFARFAKFAKATCKGQLTMYCETPLVRLFSSIEGIDEVLPKKPGWESHLNSFDYHLPMMSLLKVLGSTQLVGNPQSSYIQDQLNDTACWEKQLKEIPDGLKVGIVWQGNQKNKKGLKRSIPDQVIMPWINNFRTKCNFVCLQPERCGQPAPKSNAPNLYYLPIPPIDFKSTSELLSCLDVIITVDTAVAHLAGACGIETHLLLYATPCWRWLNGGKPNLWYPCIQTYQQTQINDWATPLEMLGRNLEKRVNQINE